MDATAPAALQPPAPPVSPDPAALPAESLASHRGRVLATFHALIANGVRAVPTHLKRPTIRWKEWQWRRPTRRELRRATCEKRGVDGYAVITGRNPIAPDTSVYVRDFDTLHAYDAWAASNPAAAAALYTVRSGRGYHVYARMPAGMPELFVSYTETNRKGELKANKGYVVGPGSLHPSGKLYTPVNFPVDKLVTDTPPMHPVDAGFLAQTEFEAAARKATGLAQKAAPAPPSRVRERGPSPSYAEVRPLTDRQVLRLRALARKHTVREEGERHARMWEFERALKGVPFLADQPPEAVLDVFEYWHDRSVGQMRGKDVERNWKDFKDSWPAVQAPTLAALRAHVRARLESGWAPEEVKGLPESCRRVAVVMAEMQTFVALLRAQDSFFLSFSLLAELADLSSSTAHAAVGRLTDAGLARVVREGKRCSGGGWATVYEYRGAWPPMDLAGDDRSPESSPSSTPSPESSMYSVRGVDSDRTESESPPKALLTYRPAVSRPPPPPAAT